MRKLIQIIFRLVSVVLLGSLLWVGFRGAPRLPPLGSLLDPFQGIWATLSSAELPTQAERVLPGLSKPVQVVYDRRRVPHIVAGNLLDAVRALGNVVARDRLFQLETQTRHALGWLTELVGVRALEFDQKMRRLSLGWAAEQAYAKLDPQSLEAQTFVAYAQGVNAAIRTLAPAELPFEYKLLGRRPFDWRPEYSLAAVNQLGYTLAGGTIERELEQIRARVGEDATQLLFPVNAPLQVPVQPNGEPAGRWDCPELPLPSLDEPRPTSPPAATAEQGENGSNNFAVSAARSASGHALLAGDPHLNMSLPSIWYEVHLVVPGELDVYGVTSPGLPAVLIGFNRDVAWSFTNTGADVLDVYRERLDSPDHPSRYLLDGVWQPLVEREEVYLDPRGDELARERILNTHRGPIWWEAGQPLSLRWLVLEQQGSSVFARLARARSAAEWFQAYGDFPVPAQNGLVADRAGVIAIRSAGWFPIRPKGQRGDIIFDGTTRASDWVGYWRPEDQPQSFDPPQGFLFSANQQPIDPRVESRYLGSDWPSAWRALRLQQLLNQKQTLTPEDLRRFQTDSQTPLTDFLLPAVLQAFARTQAAGIPDPLVTEAAQRLTVWDRRFHRDSTEASLFDALRQEIERRTWDELDGIDEERPLQPGSELLVCLLRSPDSPWWDWRQTAVKEDRDAILIGSLTQVVHDGVKSRGPLGSSGWHWENLRHANIRHLLRLPSLSALDIPIQGGPFLLNPSSGNGTHGASWRMVVELSTPPKAWTTYPGGQSGHPLSRNYKDHIPGWSQGQLEEVLFPEHPESLPEKEVSARLRLVPED